MSHSIFAELGASLEFWDLCVELFTLHIKPLSGVNEAAEIGTLVNVLI